MKNFKSILVLIAMMASLSLAAQAPQKMSYQAVVRNATGNLVTSVPVGIRISILQGSSSGTSVYTETHNTATNSNGLVSIEIGAGSIVSGNFSNIDWGNGTYFVKTETDPNGGSNFTISGTSQLLSVPYALYAGNVRNFGRATIYISGVITDSEAAAKIAEELGPITENIYIVNTTGLTTIDLTGAKNLINLKITFNTELQSVMLPDLKSVAEDLSIGGNFQVNLPQLEKMTGSVALSGTDINMPNLHHIYCTFLNIIGQNSINCPGLTDIKSMMRQYSSYFGFMAPTINMPSLTKVDSQNNGPDDVQFVNVSNFNLQGLTNANNMSIQNCPDLTQLSLPNLTSAEMMIRNTGITNLDFPNLAIANIAITDNGSLTSVGFPSLTKFLSEPYPGQDSTISGNVNLTSISFPALTYLGNTANDYRVLRIKNNKLSSNSVNAILHQMLSLPPEFGLDLPQNPPAPPTGQGLIDKATLISMGNTIYTN